ncbi:MAG: penicillin amidase [Prochlorococcaceae cyanobacterium ETNP14_MAG_5]|nr:penicillin amidase [Prochlorococcaceae cyanobacterium ETNP14_MAG_5]
MASNRHRIVLCLSLIGLAGISLMPTTSAMAVANESGKKGAKIYCFMRSNGNNHEVSWSAAYAVIKRQGGGLFKSSPEHASVMITEAVVEEPNGYPNCGQYLGDLFSSKESVNATDKETNSNSDTSSDTSSTVPSSNDSEQRYEY